MRVELQGYSTWWTCAFAPGCWPAAYRAEPASQCAPLFHSLHGHCVEHSCSRCLHYIGRGLIRTGEADSRPLQEPTRISPHAYRVGRAPSLGKPGVRVCTRKSGSGWSCVTRFGYVPVARARTVYCEGRHVTLTGRYTYPRSYYHETDE